MSSKPFYKSKTFYGSILTMVAGLVTAIWGYTVDPATVEAASDTALAVANQDWVAVATGISTVFAGIWTLYGRAKAETKLTLK